MNEWNAIDLHIHTVEGVTRDKGKDNVIFTYSLFGRAIKNHQLKLISSTNHNIIDIKNFILMKHLAKYYNCNMLLGVEIDSSLSSGHPIHIAVLFEEDFNKNYCASKAINLKTEEKKKSKEIICYSDDEIIEIIKQFNCLLIPHGCKDRGFFDNATAEHIDEALKKIREGYIRIFDSASNWKFSEIKQYLKELREENLDEFGGVLFSDNRDWNNYKFKDFYMNAEPTFNGLLHSITNPTKRFSLGKEIIRNNNYINTITIRDKNSDAIIKKCNLKLSSGYNCVIGKSGSGKSLLINMIKKHLTSDYSQDDSYSFSNNSIIEFFNEDGKKLDNTNINVGVGENLYDKIISAISSQDSEDYYKIVKSLHPSFVPKQKFNIFKNNLETSIKRYCALKETYNKYLDEIQIDLNDFFGNVKKKNELSKVKTFDLKDMEYAKNPTYTDEDFQKFNKYTEDIDSLKEKINIYKGKRKKELLNQFEKMEAFLRYASLNMNNAIGNELVMKKRYTIINDNINAINGSRSKQAKEKSELTNKEIPNNISQIVDKVLKGYITNKTIDNYDLSVNIDDCNSTICLNKDNGIVVKEYIDDKVFSKLNEKDNSLFKTHGKKQSLEDKTYDITNKEEAKQLFDKYFLVGMISSDDIKLSDSFNVKIDIFFDDKNIKQLNPGDIAKKYIDIYFKEQVTGGKFDVVLFDQIENDVDKGFINDVIRKLLDNTKGRVQMIVVTHDPIVAVNADPNNYIISQKNKNEISYRNFVAESSTTNELETIANTVDGSKDVIRRRYEIYKGDKNYDN